MNSTDYPGGTSRSITIRVPGGVVCAADSYWRDHWTGWQTWGESKDAIARAGRNRMKKRSEVVGALLAARDALASQAVTA